MTEYTVGQPLTRTEREAIEAFEIEAAMIAHGIEAAKRHNEKHNK